MRGKVGWSDRLVKIGVTSSNKSQTFKADPLVTWDGKDTWLHPVNVWKNESLHGLNSPRLLKMTWPGTYFLCFPTPKSTHNSSYWSFKHANTETASTNTSVPTVWMTIFEWPCRNISLTCKNTLVSVSSCLQGDMKEEAISSCVLSTCKNHIVLRMQ